MEFQHTGKNYMSAPHSGGHIIVWALKDPLRPLQDPSKTPPTPFQHPPRLPQDPIQEPPKTPIRSTLESCMALGSIHDTGLVSRNACKTNGNSTYWKNYMSAPHSGGHIIAWAFNPHKNPTRTLQESHSPQRYYQFQSMVKKYMSGKTLCAHIPVAPLLRSQENRITGFLTKFYVRQGPVRTYPCRSTNWVESQVRVSGPPEGFTIILV